MPLLLLCAFSAQAQQGYENLSAPQRTSNPDKVEVVEFFWYGCPHCFQFEPHISEWVKNKPDNVEFITMAPPLNPAWKIHSQAFYAAEVLGILDDFHEPMFNAIHKERKSMRKPKDIAKFVESLGFDGKKFTKTMKSFNVDAKIRQAMQKARDVGISAVPTVIVNGKYRTSGSIAGSYPRLIEVLDQLVAKESS
ncbi:hypothetical protein AB833_22615 [Chromatiales bacterium (ex Bugula neritina AB1)]|nr:hypothetical protein AB833_22615 [Chromatiales bacterium (ex Bugula neritina AB1)]